MKIVNTEEFYELPSGTLFSYYTPHTCTDLCKKWETIRDTDGKPFDFFLSYLNPQCWNEEPPAIDDTPTRDGMFGDDQLFAILEPEDYKTLKGMIL